METLTIQITNCGIDVFSETNPMSAAPLNSNPSIDLLTLPDKIKFVGYMTGFINDSGGHTIPAGSFSNLGLYPNAFDYELTGFLSDGTTPKALDPAKNYVDNYGFLHLQNDYWDSGDKITVVAKWIYDDSITDTGTLTLMAIPGMYGGLVRNPIEYQPYIYYSPNTTNSPANGDYSIHADGI